MGLLGNLVRPDVARLLKKRDHNGLLAALQHSDPTVRWEAILALNSGLMQPMAWGKAVIVLLKDPASVGILQAFLKMPNKSFATLGLLWSTAVEFPADMKPTLTALIDSLIASLKDKDANVRDFAAKVLGQSGSAQAVQPLIAALGDEHNSVRLSAGEALGAVGDGRGIDLLIEKLQTDLVAHRRGGGYSNEYESVVSALGATGHPRSAEALAFALATANSPEVQGVGGGVSERESQILRGGLAALGTVAIEPLIRLLKSENPRVRGEACNALYHIPDPRAVPALADLLDDQGEYSSTFGQERVSTRAVYALGQIGQSARDVLSKAAASPDERLRKLAAEKLAEINHST